MPAKSESQRRLFGMVLAAKRGQLKSVPAKIKNVAAHISESDAEDFARKREKVTKSMMK